MIYYEGNKINEINYVAYEVGGNSFRDIGYPETPDFIQKGIDYAKSIYDSWTCIENGILDFSNRKELVYFPLVDTSTFQSIRFANCSNLTYIPPIQVTSRVKYTSSMFYNCYKLTSLDLSNFDTSNVTNMSSMFGSCSGLTELDLSSFDTSKVTNMEQMFDRCGSLTSLNLSSFNTSNVTDMSSMFYYCNGLTELDLSSFDTSKVTDMSSMFGMCSSLIKVDGSISFKSYSSSTMNYNYLFAYNQLANLVKITYKDIGYHPNATQFNTSYCLYWGNNTNDVPDAKQSVIDSLITYSFDRATNGYSTCTVTLSSKTKGLLTEDEIAQITAKGFTIA